MTPLAMVWKEVAISMVFTRVACLPTTEMLYSLAEKIVTDSFQTQVNRFTTHFCEYATAVWTVSIMQSELTIAEQRPGTFEIIPTIRT